MEPIMNNPATNPSTPAPALDPQMLLLLNTLIEQNKAETMQTAKAPQTQASQLPQLSASDIAMAQMLIKMLGEELRKPAPVPQEIKDFATEALRINRDELATLQHLDAHFERKSSHEFTITFLAMLAGGGAAAFALNQLVAKASVGDTLLASAIGAAASGGLAMAVQEQLRNAEINKKNKDGQKK